jgi:hypothetical protein
MDRRNNNWALLILDADPGTGELGCLTVGDIDGDGNEEIVTGGASALLWYRPATFEKGVVAKVDPHVGVVLEDIDGDGIREVVVGHRVEVGTSREDWMISWFKPTAEDLYQSWTQHVLDPLTTGGPHDLLFVDVDGDGEMELIANSMYCDVPGLFIYKRNADLAQPWKKYKVQEGFSGEGTVAADLNGDGRVEIISGPYLYTCPPEGPFSAPWRQSQLAPSFREMCRAALVDVTGNGRLDVIMVESEYPDGQVSWFENQTVEDPQHPWVERPIGRPVYYAHSMCAWRDQGSGEVRVFVGEMARGGWENLYNWDARLLLFITADRGNSWRQELVYQGAGTHEATAYDVDGDGVREFVGKECFKPRVQIWKRRDKPSPLLRFRHRFLDREKPAAGMDILATDVDGDGLIDVVCASWWYRNPSWERYEIPGSFHAHNAFDIDGDGRQELFAAKKAPNGDLTTEFYWLKAVDPVNGKWEAHPIGEGDGDWAHGTAVGPLLPGGRLALITGYHSAGGGDRPELFEIPEDPTEHPWPKRVFADIQYGEEFVPYDLTGDGKLEIVAGQYWLESLDDGTFHPRQVVEGYNVARLRVVDVNGNGLPDIVVVEEGVNWETRESYFERVAWFENPGDPRTVPWEAHVIDTVRCPHSLDAADLDGDGEIEIVVGEHDPFHPYRSRSRLYAYKKAEPQARAWYRYPIDDRFEHHDGTKIFEVAPGRLAITSHGLLDSLYVHLWEVY